MGERRVSEPLETPGAARARLDAEELSTEERGRLWTRIDLSREAVRPRRRGPWVAGLLLAGAGLAAALFLARTEPEAKQPPPVASACGVDASQAELRLLPECMPQTVQVGGDEWLLRPGSAVARVGEGANVREGNVRFRVRPRIQSQFRVRVSHGEVRVIGTVFTIEQRAGKGSVTVSEGVIEFVWDDGSRERVAAGQTLRWPRPEPAAPPAPSAAVSDAGKPDAARVEPGATNDMDHVTERLLQLRSQRRYGEAASLLRKTMAGGGLSSAQQERLSYELGSTLEASGNSACAHWKSHAKRFASKRQPAALARRLARCESD
jgi:hypothetical protein